MKKKKMKAQLLGLMSLISVMFVVSCDDNNEVLLNRDFTTVQTKAIVTPTLDWENIDWMPTPPSQARIPSPWVGQGSLAATLGIDVLNDRKATDGWTLLYNSFDASAPQLINPYFILYNKYRGLMRIYLYTTTQFVTTSSYLQDGLSVVSNKPTSMLNFLGQDVVDATSTNNRYLQIQSAPYDGSYPLASNKWYMLQYELAYDPDISTTPYNQVQMSWLLNYCDVSKVSMEGEQVGTLNGTIGSAESSDNPVKGLTDAGEGVGKVVLAGIGKNFIDHNAIGNDGENKLKLPNQVFQAISKGVTSALSSAAGGLPSLGISIFSALLGGGSTTTPISLNMKTKINLVGSISKNGSFPSMPISFWMPGTSISPDATGYIPTYNKPLGVINFKGKPTIKLNCHIVTRYIPDEPFDPNYTTTHTTTTISEASSITDYSSYLVVNPEVKAIADVEVLSQSAIFLTGVYGNLVGEGEILTDISKQNINYIDDNRGGANRFPFGYVNESEVTVGLKMTIRVTPKDGAPASTIIKTFLLKPEWHTTEENINGWW